MIKNKLEWLHVGIVPNWESLVKEDTIIIIYSPTFVV